MFYTELKDRKLYFDGDSVYNPSNLLSLIKKYKVKFVDYITPSISQYNKLENNPNNVISIKSGCKELDYNWNIPDVYKNMDLFEYVFDKHIQITQGMDSDEVDQRDIRLISELQKYQDLNKLDVLKTIVYIVNELENNEIVYGIGRGSSVSSYVLYVIGIHDVDSYMYDLDINDFLRED